MLGAVGRERDGAPGPQGQAGRPRGGLPKNRYNR